MKKQLPRILIAAPSSGSGETTATCAILTLLRRRGVGVAACKCGPDYIDPMFHESVLGVPSANLDSFFCDGNLLRCLLAENGGELAVIEGVMGYYDGSNSKAADNNPDSDMPTDSKALDYSNYSTYTVASETRTPVVLVIDGKGACASLIALLEGFVSFVPDSQIRGVIFNNLTASTYSILKKLVDERFGGRVELLGYIPKLPDECILGSRHLGLVTAAEVSDLREKLDKIADLCAATLDIERLISIAENADALEFTPPEIHSHKPIRIAVARDEAFCFYYKDTLALLCKMGAEIVGFSPLANESLPDADGLYLGGGYPELYADRLQANTRTCDSIYAAVKSGMPTIAECGGFQYLGRTLEGRDMCGVLTHDTNNTGRLVRFGYVDLISRVGSLFGPAETHLRAHEFHYYDSSDNGDGFDAVKPSGRSWRAGVLTERLYAGYPHLWLYSNLGAAESFYRKCLEYKAEKQVLK